MTSDKKTVKVGAELVLHDSKARSLGREGRNGGCNLLLLSPWGLADGAERLSERGSERGDGWIEKGRRAEIGIHYDR